MRLRKAMMPRAPITNVHELSRALLALSRIEPDIEFSASVEYPDKPDGKKAKKDALVWVESWTLELSFSEALDREEEEDDEVDEETDYLDSIVVQVRELEDGSFDFKVDVEDGVTRANLDDFDDFEQVYEHVYELVYPTPKSKGQAAAIAPTLVKPSLKLVQQALTHGPQVTWINYLDIVKVNSQGEGVSFKVACAMVGHAVHIADIPYFLKAIDFDLNIMERKAHILFSSVQNELIAKINGQNLGVIEVAGKLADKKGVRFIAFSVLVNDGTAEVHAMIDLRPGEFPVGQEDEDDFRWHACPLAFATWT